MKRTSILKSIFIISIFVVLTAGAALAQTTAFNFQGRLNDGANPANGNVEMQFKLYNALSGGTQIGSTVLKTNVVINGIFTTQLDFGATAFDGSARFVEIGVRPAGNTNPFIILNPRQPVLSTPYAIQAKNAQQLGGIDASQYVTTATVGSSFIKNGTVQQTGNFNISGAGIVDSLGIGVNPINGYKLDVNGNSRFVTSNGRTISIATPNSESGLSIVGTNRADIRFDDGTLKLVAGTGNGTPTSTSGIAITTSGDVGIGTTTPISKLSVFNGTSGIPAIYGESQLNRGVWGKSFSSRGIYGESNSSQGVFGISVSGAGVQGTSTSDSGVFGTTNAASLTAGGVYGLGTGNGSIGVIGESNTGTAVGVFGVSTSPTGVGVYARNNAGGRAIFAEGNVAQQLGNGGLVKAMIYVNQDATVKRCYNSQTNSSAGNCGFTITQPLTGRYDVNFGFPVDGRFVTVTPLSNLESGGCLGGYASIDPPVGNIVRANTSCIGGSFSKPFMILVY